MRRSLALAALTALAGCAGTSDRTQVLNATAGHSEQPFVSELLFASPGLSAHRALVSGSVPLHLHQRHEETVYVIAGTGRMTVGEREVAIGPGTLVHVPRGVAHAVEADSPLSALSIFAPPFDGKDRHVLAQETAR